jgi:hypothetical protein
VGRIRRDPDAVDVGAIGAQKVDDVQTALTETQLSMATGNSRIATEDEITLAPTDNKWEP